MITSFLNVEVKIPSEFNIYCNLYLFFKKLKKNKFGSNGTKIENVKKSLKNIPLFIGF